MWDTFCDQPGAIADGSSGAEACDHYHRYAEDVALLADLGVDAYRFSVAWPRIQPHGTGPANPRGLAFYDSLIDSLLAAGVEPVCTVYHWDTPQALEDRGGWLARDTALRFADYAALLGEHFADRVSMWIPLNEPVVATLYGYGSPTHVPYTCRIRHMRRASGEYAPGKALLFGALPAAHHQNLAHGLAVTALRAAGAAAIGTANNHSPIWPRRPEDRAAAAALGDLLNWLFADPVLLGTYPESMREYLPEHHEDDLASIAVPLDFYGVNYYEPQACTDVTENGCSGADTVDDAGMVHDAHRIDHLTDHLAALHKAMADGVDVRGYFVWSLLDNFEWSKGYGPRFGLVHVDYSAQTRTPKDSYRWYQGVIGGHDHEH